MSEKPTTLDEWTNALIPAIIGAHSYDAEKKEKANGSPSKELAKVTENVVSIRFTDCDPFGHLNNGRYIDYFINGRDFHMDEFYGLHLAKHALQHKETYVVKEHQIAYVKPARLRERVCIRAMLLAYTDSSTFVESQMLNEAGDSLKSLLWSEFSYVDLNTKKQTNQPENIMKILRDTLSEVDEYKNKDFAGRLKSLRKQLN